MPWSIQLAVAISVDIFLVLAICNTLLCSSVLFNFTDELICCLHNCSSYIYLKVANCSNFRPRNRSHKPATCLTVVIGSSNTSFWIIDNKILIRYMYVESQFSNPLTIYGPKIRNASKSLCVWVAFCKSECPISRETE